ncbi:MAG: protein translocase SEC61 complex subunit gamma [Candidatus Aenigmarchaeota archaeon]|nr:protein translocase SEC61 complex subunit gamma [Candidatus Aenigmarchaeota archaeon]
MLKGTNVQERLREYRRVLQIARKPTKDEFFASSKVTSIGIALIGLIGFLIFLAFIISGI